MNIRRSYAVVLSALGLVALATNPAHPLVAPGPYYATPSWDQQLPASTRFILLSNWNHEAVLDRETGLVWEQTPGLTNEIANNAHETCNRKRLGGRWGW